MMDTLSQVLARLETAGYRGTFTATDGGLHCPACDGRHDPEVVDIDEIVRFEGESDPDDEAVVFALSCEHCAAKGTYIAAYGPAVNATDAQVIRRLHDRRHR